MLYSRAAVRNLAHEKAKFLGKELPDPSQPRSPRPGSSADRRHPVRPTVKILEYLPPSNASPDDPAPEMIIWKGEEVTCPVNVADACLLYMMSLLLFAVMRVITISLQASTRRPAATSGSGLELVGR